MPTNKIIRANGTQTLKLGDGIEINQSTGTVTVPGDLIVSQNFTVNGTSITINTANLDVEDKNITINKNGNDTSAEGAGLTVERAGTDGSLIYDSTLISKWKLGNVGSESEVIVATGNQTIAGVKTFSSDPTFTSGSQLVTGGAQTIAGAKTFTGETVIQNGGNTLRLGADLSASTLTDATRKYAYVTVPAYTNAEENILLAQMETDTAFNVLRWGGGDGSYNAVTEHRFYTAASATTLTGTERMRITSTGNVGIGTASPVSLLQVQRTTSAAADEVGGIIRVGSTFSEEEVSGAILFSEQITNANFNMGIAYSGQDNALYFLGPGTGTTDTGASGSVIDAYDNRRWGSIARDTGAWTLGPANNNNSVQHIVNGRLTIDFGDGSQIVTIGVSDDATVSGSTHYISVGSNVLPTGTTGGSLTPVQWHSASGALVRITSSQKYKTEIQDLPVGLTEVLALTPRVYERVGNPGVQEYGLIAEEVDLVLPTLVSKIDGETEGLNEFQFKAVLVKAIQELKAELDEAKDRIAQLEAAP